MKKTLLAIALGSLTMATSAFADFYVQGDVGYSRTKIEDYKKDRFEPRISVGYKLQDFRVAVDYTYYRDIKESDVDFNAKLKTNGVGVSAIYDIPVQSDLQPYVGVRLAINRIKDTSTDTSGGYVYDYSESSTSLGYGAIVGATYPLAQNLKLNAGLEYNHLGRIDGDNVRNYGAKVGLRYDF